MHIDLNCDLGEGSEFDAELMPLITSANIACGFHAGDALTMRQTILLAMRYGVRLGAHPGFNDRAGFGRTELELSEEQIVSECVYQIGAFAALAQKEGGRLAYVKPHGALYNMACRDERYARPVIAAVEAFQVPLLGLPGSRLQALSAGRCPFVAEGFADRRYRPDGSLVPRSEMDAFVHDVAEAVTQARQLIGAGRIQTLCVHGDNPQAVAFVKALRQALV